MGLSLDENDDSGLGHHGVNKGVPALNGTTDFDDSGDDDAGDAGSDTENDSQDSVYAGTDLDKAFKTIYENKWYWPSIVRTRLRRNRICMSTSMERSAAVSPCSTRPTASCQWERRAAKSHGSVDGKNVGKSASGKETK